MMATPSRNARKVVEAVNLLISEGGMDADKRLKVVKNLWAADRYSLRRFGHTITDPLYAAMKLGPVPSFAYRLINQDATAAPEDLELWKNSFEIRGHDIVPISEIGTSTLSLVDQTMLLKASRTFNSFGRFELANDISHRYPEWLAQEARIRANPSTSVKINNFDFFRNPDVDPYFLEDAEILSAAREAYGERAELSSTTGLNLM
ncbi:Panacea domain-containing protein [Corynebacterium minutissimum]